MFRPHVVFSISSRNFAQYFTSVIGYLFIFVFVTLCAILAFSPQFFVENLVSVDHLTRWFPMLLLFLVPAITMSSWADESRQGTDSLLFTLPASDVEILAGKYLSVVGVYTVALLFSCTQLIALAMLGSPDWGVIVATWFGYWLAGIAMLAIGLFASSLTSSSTVAFVIGSLLCAVPVMIGLVFEGNQTIESFGAGPRLHDFSLGQIPLSGVIYFLSIAAIMLYLNLVVISRRRWSRGRSMTLAPHFAARVLALSAALVSLNILVERASSSFPARLDLTAENLYTLDEATHRTIANASEQQRPVTVQAFVSPQVPAKYVNARKRLLGLLKQYERLGKGNIDVRIVDVHPSSNEVDEARSLGIVPRPSREEVAGKSVEQDVYLGAVITSSLDEVVLPFIDGETSIEYELTRSIATTTVESRKLKIGVLKTDAHFNNLEAQGRIYDWSYARTVSELGKQYTLATIDPAILPKVKTSRLNADKDTSKPDAGADAADEKGAEVDGKPAEAVIDVLIVVDPSSLSSEGLDNLVNWIRNGNPTLIMADPLPFFWYVYQAPRELGIINAPSSPRIQPDGSWAVVSSTYKPREPWDQSPPVAEPKPFGGRCTPLLEALGIEWGHDQMVWSVNNPHLSFKPVFPARLGRRWPAQYGPREAALLFARDSGDFHVFNREEDISAGLQEVLFSYTGSIAPVKKGQTIVKPLVSLKPGTAGQFSWDEITEDLVATYPEMDRMTGQVREITGPVPSEYTGNTIRVLRSTAKAAPKPLVPAEDGQNPEPESEKVKQEKEKSDKADGKPESRLKQDPCILAARIQSKNSDKDTKGIDVVFIADADFASDFHHEQQTGLEKPLDNLTFLVNAIESLAGDKDLVRLRNRRAAARTLTTLETLTEQFRIEAAKALEQVDVDIDQRVADARSSLEKKASRISEDQEMSVWQKIQEAGLSAASEQRKLDKQLEKLEREREQKSDAIAIKRQQQIDRIESRIRWISILSAGVPALLLGIFVLGTRITRERRNITPERRVSQAA
jgi:ABC-2 type transport system permease protein